MKIFKLNKDYQVVCDYVSTRSGFKHVATLLRDGIEVSDTKVCYQNRTWEKFQYETVIHKIIDMYFNEPEITKFKKKINNTGDY